MKDRKKPAGGPAQPSAPYTALAAGYDVVMAHVEYDVWAEYIYGLLRKHHPDVRRLLELGCGTGSFGLELQPLGPFAYVGTDRSEPMLRVAREKAALYGTPAQFEMADFTNYRVDEPVDAVVLLYDGLNYLLEPDPIRDLLRCTYAALRPGGVFLLDQSTPANSVNNEPYFHDEGEEDLFSYVRRSAYDRETKLHTTTLELTIGDERYLERHVQRAYTLAEIRPLIEETAFELVTVYDGFSTAPATEASERVHWVLRRPAA